MRKSKAKIFVIFSLLLCLISSIGASVFQTNFGEVEYHDMTFVTESGHTLDALLLVPKTATANSKAPAIVVSHGWYNNREMQDLNYVEYARRGYVVLAISMYGHGDSEVIESNTWWDDSNNANGLYDGVKYLANLPYVDAERIGVTGHSNGALACREAVLQDEEGLIAAALLVSNDAVYYDENGNFYNQFGSRDAAIVACQYDEFFHRVDGNAPRDYINQVTAQSFLHFGVNPEGLDMRTADTYYRQTIDGEEAIRAIYNPAITHPWAHFSSEVVSFSVDFFDEALDAPIDLDNDDQIWRKKAAFNAFGIIGFFIFVVSAAIAMLELPYFSVLKAEEKVRPWPKYTEDGSKRRVITTGIFSAIFSIIFYFIAFIAGMMLQSDIWNQGPSRIIGLWCVLCGIFTYLCIKIGRRRNPVDKLERGSRIGFKKMWRSLVLAVCVTVASFAIVFLSDAIFLTDYRLWCFATIRAFNIEQHLPMILVFVPMWLVYYVALSVSANCYNFTAKNENKSGLKSVIGQMILADLGPIVMIVAQYVTFFGTGKMILDPLTGIMGIWLIPIAVIIPIAILISNIIYRKTKNPYIGGIIMGIIACILTVTNTLTG